MLCRQPFLRSMESFRFINPSRHHKIFDGITVIHVIHCTAKTIDVRSSAAQALAGNNDKENAQCLNGFRCGSYQASLMLTTSAMTTAQQSCAANGQTD
jgi:hypothetical protein